ncbi:MAG: hypothetical protein JRH20_29805 [Deltaproteobacteria bacterium]|nr:hypothetical protein [Deltaproteobacteria bacterium]
MLKYLVSTAVCISLLSFGALSYAADGDGKKPSVVTLKSTHQSFPVHHNKTSFEFGPKGYPAGLGVATYPAGRQATKDIFMGLRKGVRSFLVTIP